MITEEELYNAAHARFGGSEIQDSACRGAWTYGANWAIAKMKAENEYLRAALGRVIALHEKHGGDYTEYMYHTYQEIEKIKNELGKK